MTTSKHLAWPQPNTTSKLKGMPRSAQYAVGTLLNDGVHDIVGLDIILYILRADFDLHLATRWGFHHFNNIVSVRHK